MLTLAAVSAALIAMTVLGAHLLARTARAPAEDTDTARHRADGSPVIFGGRRQ